MSCFNMTGHAPLNLHIIVMNDLSTLCQNFHHKMIDHNFKEIKFSSGRVQSMIIVMYLLFVKF